MVTMVSLTVLGMVALVAVVAAVSYSHMFDWAQANGEPLWRARLSPIAADGAILVASIVMYVDARVRHRADPVAYGLLGFGIAWSIFGNVMHDWVSPVAAKLIAGWPPVAMAATVELLMRFARRLRERSDDLARRDEESRRKAEKTPARVTTPTPPAEQPPALVVPDAPTPVGPSLTEEMRVAGWAPEDYRNVGDAMLGYLEKVDPKVGGADLHRLVGVPFFGATADTGMGRKSVQKFKAAQAAATMEKE